MTAKKTTVPVVIAELGRIIIAVGPNCWGEGDRSDIALKNARKHLPYASEQGVKAAARYAVYDCPDDTYVNGMGQLVYLPAKGEPVLVIEESR
jgi:hypothetical protein